MPDDFVTIARFAKEVEAYEARIELESADIECLIADDAELDPTVFGGLTGAAAFAIQVPESQVDKAVQILRDTPAARNLLAGPGDQVPEQPEGEEDAEDWDEEAEEPEDWDEDE